MSLRKALREAWQVHGHRANNPGFWVIVHHELGRWVQAREPGPARAALEAAFSLTARPMEVYSGVRLPPETQVGARLHLIHTGLIDIHPEVIIGDDVGIMQGVTIRPDPSGRPGAPIIEDGVFIGTHATVLGPVRVGRGARIAANSLVVEDVPANAVAIGVPAKIYPGLGWVRAQSSTEGQG